MTFAGGSGTIVRMTDKADLPDDIERLKAMLMAERAEKATIAAERDRMAAQNDRLAHMLRQFRRNQQLVRRLPLHPHPLTLPIKGRGMKSHRHENFSSLPGETE